MANRSKDRALNPETQSKNLHYLVFFNIVGTKKSTSKEKIELNMYIKLTFFSEEKKERKLELK